MLLRETQLNQITRNQLVTVREDMLVWASPLVLSVLLSTGWWLNTMNWWPLSPHMWHRHDAACSPAGNGSGWCPKDLGRKQKRGAGLQQQHVKRQQYLLALIDRQWSPSHQCGRQPMARNSSSIPSLVPYLRAVHTSVGQDPKLKTGLKAVCDWCP